MSKLEVECTLEKEPGENSVRADSIEISLKDGRMIYYRVSRIYKISGYSTYCNGPQNVRRVRNVFDTRDSELLVNICLSSAI